MADYGTVLSSVTIHVVCLRIVQNSCLVCNQPNVLSMIDNGMNAFNVYNRIDQWMRAVRNHQPLEKKTARESSSLAYRDRAAWDRPKI